MLINRDSLSVRTVSFPIFERHSVELDASFNVLWSTWRESGKPCFSTELQQDMQFVKFMITEGTFSASLRYFMLRSRWHQVLSLGENFEYFPKMIFSQDRQGLLSYAPQSADMMLALHSGLSQGAASIALVQGRCIGGGFDAAVACDYRFPERHAAFSFPDIRLGIYPGLVALPILARPLCKSDCEEICHSGRTFAIDELRSKGAVDFAIEDGQGEQAVLDCVKKRRSSYPSHQKIMAIRKHVSPLSASDFRPGQACGVDSVMSLDTRRRALLTLAARKQRLQ